MTTRTSSLAAVVAIALLFLMPACVTDGNTTVLRTDSGQKVRSNEWRDMKPQDFMINVADLQKFPSLEEVTADRRIRDNAMTRHRVRLDKRQATIVVDHLPVSWFSTASTSKLMKSEDAKRDLTKWWVKSYERDAVVWEDSTKVFRNGSRGGWGYKVKIGPRKLSCILASLGFLSKNLPSHVPSGTTYDTIVFVRDCSGNRVLKDYVAFFEGVKLVPPEYNRAAG